MGVSCAWKMTLEFAGALISFVWRGLSEVIGWCVAPDQSE